MDFLNQLAAHYESLFSALSCFLGIAGFIFGMWRYFREQRAREALGEREQELREALSRLQRLKSFAAEIKHYYPAV